MDTAVEPPVTSASPLPYSLNQLNPWIIDDLIRLGVTMDGGYLVPESAVVNADALLSFGLGHDWSFERHAAELNPRMVIHIYDHTIGERKFLCDILSSCQSVQQDQAATATDAAVALFGARAFLRQYESYRRFFQGKFVHFQERVFDRIEKPDDATLEKVFARLEQKSNVILKMDIEGGEYRIIDGLLTYQDRIPAMIIEFHATEFLRDLFLEKVANLGRHYVIVHVHGNNYVGVGRDGLPDLLEMTFLHKRLCSPTARRGQLPLAGLDFPNDPREEDHELLFSQTASG